jgi:hypothetical protein
VSSGGRPPLHTMYVARDKACLLTRRDERKSNSKEVELIACQAVYRIFLKLMIFERKFSTITYCYVITDESIKLEQVILYCTEH